MRDRLLAAGVDVELEGVPLLDSDDALGPRADLVLLGGWALGTEAVEGLTTLAVLPREDPRDVLVTRPAEAAAVGPASATRPGDALVSGDSVPLRSLSAGARVGLSGVRRKALLAAHRPDAVPCVLDSDLDLVGRLEAGTLDAAVLGAGRARRLGLGRSVTEVLDPRAWLPAAGQGAVALVARHPMAEATALDHLPTRVALRAELALLDALSVALDPLEGEGSAVGALAQASGRWIRLWGMVASPDGRFLVRSDLTGPLDEPCVLGGSVARQLLQRGAERLLATAGA